MARLNWKTIYHIMKAHGWRDVDLCRMMGVSQPFFSDLKRGRRPVTMPTVDMLLDVLRPQGGYNSLLVHETYNAPVTARERLKIRHLEDGRPWPQSEQDQEALRRMKNVSSYTAYLHSRKIAEENRVAYSSVKNNHKKH